MMKLDQVNKTVIAKKLKARGTFSRLVGQQVGYKFIRGGSSSWYDVANGKKVPKAPERRRKLAALLACLPDDLWRLNEQGKLVARKVSEL